MLPLLGRTQRKAPPTITGFNDEWVVPSEQDLYGKIRSGGETNECKSYIDQLKTVEEDSNESETITSEISTSEISTGEVSVFNGDDGIISDIGESFADETFSVVNESTSTSVEPEIIEDVTNEVIEISTIDTVAFMDRLNELEKKFAELNVKVSKMETGSYSNNNPSIFVNEFINAMHEMMKTGMSYQQRVVGKFIEELDQMFAIDFTDFDPFK